jgi:long-chain acyl-CoA synthetase
MGNTNFTKLYFYNKIEDKLNKRKSDYAGPYILPTIKNFEKEVEDYYKDKTLIGKVLEKMKEFKDRPCLGRRLKIGETKEGSPIFEKKYTYFTYNEVEEFCYKFAKNLHEKRDEFIIKDSYINLELNLVGIFAKNCIEWVITDFGCHLDSVTNVTLYSTLGQEAFKFICEETKIKTIFVSPDLVDSLCEYKNKFNLNYLRNAILYDFTTNCDTKIYLEKLKNANFNAISFTSEFLKENDNIKKSDLILSQPDTTMTICYTSGTSGNPKGVMISQRNMIVSLETIIRDTGVPLDEYGAHLSFLPLAHIFERIIISGFMISAARIGFISTNVKNLVEDMSIFGPTIVCLVPRVMQTIRTKIFDSFNSLNLWQKELAYKAYYTKLENFRKYGIINHVIYDQIIFKKVRNMFGGKVKCLLSASAPMQKELADDFKIFFSVPIIEALGMTELSGASFCTNTKDLTNLTTGGVTGGAKLILRSVPELNYYVDDIIDGIECPAGEICVKGPMVFQGYYKNDEENNKSFDKDGYFHTGDVGRLFPNLGNGLRVVDRVKEIFKLSQGEYIVPAKLESIYYQCPYIKQIMVYGNSNMNNIIAIIQPDLERFSNEFGISIDELSKDEENPKLKELIRKDLERYALEAKFNGLEKVKYMILTFEVFTVNNGCMTPTMKIVRKKVELRFKERINKIYKDIKYGK